MILPDKIRFVEQVQLYEHINTWVFKIIRTLHYGVLSGLNTTRIGGLISRRKAQTLNENYKQAQAQGTVAILFEF